MNIFQRFKVISITVMPPSDFGVLYITFKQSHSKLYAVQANVIKKHNIAVTVNVPVRNISINVAIL